MGSVLGPGTFTIGRAPECCIVVKDDGLARLHAQIVVGPHGVWLFDRGSGGGSQVDGGSVITTRLPDHATLLLGTVPFLFASNRRGPWSNEAPLALRDEDWRYPRPIGVKPAAGEGVPRFGPYVLLGPVHVRQPSTLHRATRPGMAGECYVRIYDPRSPSASLSELQRLVPIVHPNVIRVLEASIWEGQLYAVLEPWEGELTLDRARPSGETLALIRGFCAGLGAAHAAGVVHGDLRLGHIHLAGGTARLDFSDCEPLMIGGLMARNASLLAPEVIRGGPLDRRADVFMAACLCYELLTGRRPFGNDGPMQVWFRTVNEEPQFEGVPPPLADWLRRALAKDPAARFQTGAELGEALEGALDGQAAQASGK